MPRAWRPCEECGSEYDDPADKKRFGIAKTAGLNHRHKTFLKHQSQMLRVKPRAVEGKTRYLCSWCALTRIPGDWKFLRNRGVKGRDLDADELRSLSDQLKLDPEPAEDDWYFGQQPGRDFGKGWEQYWEQYFITYAGIIEKGLDKPRPNSDARDPVRICQVRVFHKYSLAYLEITYPGAIPPDGAIKNALRVEDSGELSEVWKARELYQKVVESRGRGLWNHADTFEKDAVEACVRLLNRSKGSNRLKAQDIANALLKGMAKETLHATCRRLHVPLDKIKRQARSLSLYTNPHRFLEKAVEACIELYRHKGNWEFPSPDIARKMGIPPKEFAEICEKFSITTTHIREQARQRLADW